MSVFPFTFIAIIVHVIQVLRTTYLHQVPSQQNSWQDRLVLDLLIKLVSEDVSELGFVIAFSIS